jgi:hypothetical protein
MRTYGSDVRSPRTLAQIIEDATAIIMQDIGEYAFIALLGAFPATSLMIMLRAIGGPLFPALVIPAVLYCMALTLAAGGIAFHRVTTNLAPDAFDAWGATLARASVFIRPWTGPALLGFAIVFALRAFEPLIGGVPSTYIVLAAIAGAVTYTLPRTFYIPALLTQEATPRECEAGSAHLVGGAPRKAVSAWACVLAPSFLLTLAAAGGNFGVLWSAAAVFVFIATMPAAAIVTTLLFYDALARAETLSARTHPRARAARPSGRRV